MEKGKVLIGLGLILNALSIFLRRGRIEVGLPEHISCFIQGMILVLGMGMILYGAYIEKHGVAPEIKFKKKNN